MPVILILLSMIFLSAEAAAHGTEGKRSFPGTLAIEEPGVEDELIFPKIHIFKETEDGVTAWNREFEAEFSKKLTDRLAIIGGAAYVDQSNAGGGQSGFENFELTGKYQFYENAEHEIVISAGLGWSIGDSGSDKIGVDEHSTITPQIYFGKGFGDLPDSMHYLKPFAITGQIGYDFVTDHYDDAGDGISDTLNYGFSFQYSLPYLAEMNGSTLGAPFNRIIPLVEITASQPVNRAGDYDTTGTINPGFIWAGDDMQFGIEAVLPLTKDSGQGVGILAQMNFPMEELFE